MATTNPRKPAAKASTRPAAARVNGSARAKAARPSEARASADASFRQPAEAVTAVAAEMGRATRDAFDKAGEFAANPAQMGTMMTGQMAGMQERTKEVAERGQKFVAEMSDLAKGNVEAMVEAARIAAKGAEELSREGAEIGRKGFEEASAVAKKMAEAKSPAEVLKLQSDYAKSAMDQLVATGAQVTERMVKLMGESVQPLQGRFAIAAEKAKATLGQ